MPDAESDIFHIPNTASARLVKDELNCPRVCSDMGHLACLHMPAFWTSAVKIVLKYVTTESSH